MIDSPYFRFIYALKAPETKRQYPKRLDGLAYITKENNYDYSIDVFEDKLLKSNIPIKYLYDEITTNPSNGLVYMLDGDIVYLIENGSIVDKIIINSEEEESIKEKDLF